jgi:hypothetical protein
MEPEEYLKQILKNHSVDIDSSEMKKLQETRKDVEALIRGKFADCSPTIRYGGSKVKGTMIIDAYDLDIVSYFPHDDTCAGETLKDIYDNAVNALAEQYYVEPRRSAIRIRSKDSAHEDFHIDVVPGRFTDDTKSDAFLYQAEGEKGRLKTNLDVHIAHIRDSGLVDVIQLAKLWKVRNSIDLKTFGLELLVIKYTTNSKKNHLETGLVSFWEYLHDHGDNITIEDPANPGGNDLSVLLSDSTKALLSMFAKSALNLVEAESWESIFGPAEVIEEAEKAVIVERFAPSYANAPKPWLGRK